MSSGNALITIKNKLLKFGNWRPLCQFGCKMESLGISFENWSQSLSLCETWLIITSYRISFRAKPWQTIFPYCHLQSFKWKTEIKTPKKNSEWFHKMPWKFECHFGMSLNLKSVKAVINCRDFQTHCKSINNVFSVIYAVHGLFVCFSFIII